MPQPLPPGYTPPDSASPTVPYTSTAGQTFIGGTQTTDPTTGAVTGNGILGQGYVPGFKNQLLDLGGGMVAPAPGVDVSKGITGILPPIIPNDYSPMGMHIGDVTAAGKITGWNQLGGPIYDSSATNPNVADPFAHTWDGAQAADLWSQGFGINPFGTPGNTSSAIPTAPNPPASNGNVIPTNAPKLTMGGPTPGAPNDAGPGLPLGSASAPPQGGTPGASRSFANGVNLSPTTVDNALTNFTISPNNTVDRVKLAQDALQNTIQNVLDPAYHARERDLNRYNFGAGRGVSGEARTSQGDVASDYGRQVANLSNNLLNAATNGSIEDLYRNIGIAQQQQGFQAGQQNTAFQQALQQLMAGNQGNPADVALMLSQIFGSEGNSAGNAAGNYLASQQQMQNQQQLQQMIQQMIAQSVANGQNAAAMNTAGQGINTSGLGALMGY